jgi:predicted RNase H-like HicB family nuclease
MRSECLAVDLVAQASGQVVALVPRFPDVLVIAATPEAALSRARDAVRLYLEAIEECGWRARTCDRVWLQVDG